MRNRILQICAVLVVLTLLVGGGVYLALANGRIHPELFANRLAADAEIYDGLDEVADASLVDRLYRYDSNQFIAGVAVGHRMPNTANEQNLVPALKHNGDVFVITYKWVNFSRGLAISLDSEFVSKMHSIDPGLTVWHIGGDVYGWDVELDSSKHTR